MATAGSEERARAVAVRGRGWAVAAGWVFLALVLAALVLGVAFQQHPAVNIAIGDPVQDNTVVRDFNAAETQAAAAGGRSYRWTQGQSTIVLPGIGRTAATVTLTLAGGANPAPQVRLLANGGELTRLTLTPDFADYTVPVPAAYLRTGNLILTLESPPFHAPGDRRELGVLISRVRVISAGGIALPPARVSLALWGAVAFLTLALVVVGLSGFEAGVAGLTVAIAIAAGLVGNRLFVTVAASAWLRVGIAACVLAVVLRFIISVFGWRVWSGEAEDLRWILAAAVTIFATRLGGLWHPAIIVSDLTFHVHRFEDVVLRHQWYQEIPALYASGRPVPYPPGAYLLFAPFAAFVPDHAALLTLGTQVLDSARVVLVGIVAWRVTGDKIAGTCATVLAGAVPVAFLLFSWGNLTDATGEVALTVVFALLALAWPRLREPKIAMLFMVALLFTMLAHIGVAVTAVAFLGMAVSLGAVSLLRRGGVTNAVRSLAPLVGLSLIAGVLAIALFYRIPLTGVKAAVVPDTPPSAITRVTNGYTIGAPRPDATIGLPGVQTANPLVAVVGQLAEEAWAFYRGWPLLLAPVGAWLLNRSARESDTTMVRNGASIRLARSGTRYAVLAVAAWLVGAVVLLVVGVLTGQFVRYAVSAMPAVAVGAGVVLAYGWRWPWGRVVVVALLALTVLATLIVWYGRITRTYHV